MYLFECFFYLLVGVVVKFHLKVVMEMVDQVATSIVLGLIEYFIQCL